MKDTLLNLLHKVDTPTVCNAIEVAQGKRGFNAFTRGTMLASHPDAPAMVGYARTARIAAVAPPTEAPEVINARRMAYYRHMSEGPRPAIVWLRTWTSHIAWAPIGVKSTRPFTKVLACRVP